MFKLRIHEDADEDLEEIAKNDPDAAAFLIVFLEELEGDQDLLDRLTQDQYNVKRRRPVDWVADFNVKVWIEQRDANRNLWRLQAWDIDASQYRVVYAFEPATRTYGVLGVFHKRQFNYESNNPLTRRVLAAYANT